MVDTVKTNDKIVDVKTSDAIVGVVKQTMQWLISVKSNDAMVDIRKNKRCNG